MITIIQESLITLRRNTDHDHPGIAITIVRESLITIPRNPQRLRALPIRVELNDVWANIELESKARKWNLPAYDAAYLDLALRRKLSLATADDDLRKAAQAEGIMVLL